MRQKIIYVFLTFKGEPGGAGGSLLRVGLSEPIKMLQAILPPRISSRDSKGPAPASPTCDPHVPNVVRFGPTQQFPPNSASFARLCSRSVAFNPGPIPESPRRRRRWRRGFRVPVSARARFPLAFVPPGHGVPAAGRLRRGRPGTDLGFAVAASSAE
jgi:hypothetical protein